MGSKIDLITGASSEFALLTADAVGQIHASENVAVVLFDAEGTALDGRTYTNTYAWFLEMQRGRIVSAFAFFDSIAFNDLWPRVTPADRKEEFAK